MSPRRTLAGLLVCVALAVPARAADDAPERLLPLTTQVYLRWDGIAAHADAYQRSALGQVFAGEMGRTFGSVRARLERTIKVQTVGEKLLAGAPPKELRSLHQQWNSLLRLPEVLSRTGLVLGFEADALPPTVDLLLDLPRVARGKEDLQTLLAPHLQLTAVLPGAGEHPEVAQLLKALAEGSGVKPVRIHRRACHVLTPGSDGWNWAWWMEGKHLVFVGSTREPEAAVSHVLGAGAGVTAHPLYARLREGQPDCEVTTRGFIDGEGLSANLRVMLRDVPLAVPWLEDLGLFDIKGVRFWEGFEGRASRSVLEAEIASTRRGINRFHVPKALDLKTLPPLPADAHRWTAARTDPSAVFELFLGYMATVQSEDRTFAETKETLRRAIDDALGVKLADLFGALGDTFLTYYSPGDGLPGLGQVIAVSVKDERALTRTFDGLGRKLSDLADGELNFRTRRFHGATLREFVIPGSPVTVTYTIHKGWLVLALNPQPVQGFVLRSAGKLPVWKPDARTAKALAKVPADAGLVQVVDPRPSVQLLLAAAPIVGGLLGGEALIDAGDLPHAGAVTRHLFPNVAWTRFDGRTFRKDSRDSLALPFQEIGLEWLPLVYAAELLLVPPRAR
jgi:hypothetical protein